MSETTREVRLKSALLRRVGTYAGILATVLLCQAGGILIGMLGGSELTRWLAQHSGYRVVMSVGILIPAVTGGALAGGVLAALWRRGPSQVLLGILGISPAWWVLKDSFTWQSTSHTWGGTSWLLLYFIVLNLAAFALSYGMVQLRGRRNVVHG